MISIMVYPVIVFYKHQGICTRLMARRDDLRTTNLGRTDIILYSFMIYLITVYRAVIQVLYKRK